MAYLWGTVRSPFVAVRELRFALNKIVVRQYTTVFNEIFYMYLTAYEIQFEV